MTDITETERKIAERMDPAATGALVLSKETGGLGFTNMEGAMQFAKFMALSQFAVPKHLRGNPGACLAITIQAVEWKMSPFSVANKSYLVDDRLAYESQLVQAVVLQRAPIVGRFDVSYTGQIAGPKQIKIRRRDGEHTVTIVGGTRRCKVSATLKDGQVCEYESPEIGAIENQNSPLWKNDPDQQLFYFAGRNLCRRFFPDVLLGIYTPDELYDEMRRGPDYARDVTPKAAPPDTGEIYANLSGAKTAEIISDEMAKQAQERARQLSEAMADQTGEKAAALLADTLEERTLEERRKHGFVSGGDHTGGI